MPAKAKVSGSVVAGFPSPAEQYQEPLDLRLPSKADVFFGGYARPERASREASRDAGDEMAKFKTPQIDYHVEAAADDNSSSGRKKRGTLPMDTLTP